MSLTNPGDLYVAVNDSIGSKIFALLQAQRPSLLNYATAYFINNPAARCVAIASPANGAPTFSTLKPIEFPVQTGVPPVELLVQITQVAIGFGVDTVGLPPDMLPLPPQRAVTKMSFVARFAVPRLDPASLGCPGQQLAHANYPLELCDCFSGSMFLTAAAAFKQCGTASLITFALDRFDTTNLTPAGLRQSVDRLIVLILDTQILPKLWPSIAPFVIDLDKALPPSAPIRQITLAPTATSLNPNPDISGDALQARLNLKVTAP